MSDRSGGYSLGADQAHRVIHKTSTAIKAPYSLRFSQTQTHCCFKSPALQIFLLQLRKETQVGFNNSEAALSLDYAWEQKQRGTDQDLSGHSKKARLTAEVSRYTEEAQGSFFSLGWHSCISFKPALTLCPCQQTRLNIGSHIWDKVQNLLKIYLLIFC